MADMTIDEVKETVGKGLEVARWKLLTKNPFIGEMLLRFSIIPTYDCRINTAATDGTKIYFDCEFYSKLTKGQREFVLAHEVWHNIFLHFTRMGVRDATLWNIATDMEINHMLQNDGMEIIADACLPDPVVAGKNAEDIYAYLNKQNQKNQQKQKSNDKGGNSQGNGDNDGDSGDNEGDGQSNGNNQTNTGNNKTSHGNQFDKHIREGEGEGAGQGEPKDGKWGEKGYDNDYNPTMKNAKETEDKIKEMVCSVAQSIERRQGNLPSGVKNLVEKMLKPEVNWKEALAQFVTSCFGGEHSWKRCSRHVLGRGMYLPGRKDEKLRACLILDTSGSYLQDMPKFLGEFKSLVESFGSYEITMIECDCEVQNVTKYNDDVPMDFKNWNAHGGGGSDFRPAFKEMRELGEEFSCCIAFTDGYIDVPTYDPGIPTLFVLPKDGQKEFCEWGQKMVYKAEENG